MLVSDNKWLKVLFSSMEGGSEAVHQMLAAVLVVEDESFLSTDRPCVLLLN